MPYKHRAFIATTKSIIKQLSIKSIQCRHSGCLLFSVPYFVANYSSFMGAARGSAHFYLHTCPSANRKQAKRQNKRTDLSRQFGFINATTKPGLLEPSTTLMITKSTILHNVKLYQPFHINCHDKQISKRKWTIQVSS